MDTRTRGWIAVWAVAAAVVVVVLMVWKAADARDATEAWPVPEQTVEADVEPGDGTWRSPEDVDRSDPDAVAEFVAQSAAQFDTVTDPTEASGFLRAGELIDSSLAARNMPAEKPTDGAAWLRGQQEQAFTSAVPERAHPHFIEDGELVSSAEGEDVLPYMFEVSYDWQPRTAADSWDGGTRTVMLSLADRPEGWTVVEYSARTVVEQDGAQ